MFLHHFNELFSKINFKKIKKKYYFDEFQMKNTLKNNHHHNTKRALRERLGTRCKQRSPKIYLFFC
jgi:hypothetical protein